ncbi:hypothetical protein BRC91_03190 [Halobacteriales archaeon QS_4_62_28]|nr:MAG: hypothetical protein BRC91_03190 [Halobacteriales archaeon QS_4_62_28]
MQSLVMELLDSIVSFPDRFIDIALSDPLSALLIAFGALFVGASSAVFGYLTLGAAVDLIIPDVSGRQPPRAGR